MWKIEKPKINLPEGWELYESVHFVYLFFNGRRIAIFNANTVTPNVIEEAIKKEEEKQNIF